MAKDKVEKYPIDLLTEGCKCPHCGINKGYIDTGGVVEGRRLLKCVNCGEIVYGCD